MCGYLYSYIYLLYMYMLYIYIYIYICIYKDKEDNELMALGASKSRFAAKNGMMLLLFYIS